MHIKNVCISKTNFCNLNSLSQINLIACTLKIETLKECHKQIALSKCFVESKELNPYKWRLYSMHNLTVKYIFKYCKV